ncbi:MAG TPA: aldo/keto reductase [Actinomycetes bacterium]|nr:aldo/keto reductase [Actinomycetes bacterium]
METRTLGRLGPVSALTLGGGGLGRLWGPTSREEAVATVREAVDAGISLLDVAPRYGDGEAERVVGEAFGGHLPAGVRVSTKHRVSNPPAPELPGQLERSLDESLDRMKLGHVDLFFLHGYLVAEQGQGGERRTPRRLFADAARPAFERLVAQGRIGAWGITAVGVPSVVLEVLAEDPAPGAVQAITNPLDSAGELRRFEEPARPREIIAAAHARGVGVMGIRAVQAGALTDRLDRDLPADDPTAADYRRAAPWRALARELGEPAASLAHRYALSMPGVDTVVLGVKNRAELREGLAAEAKGPLPPELIREIDTRLARTAS